MRGFTDKYVEAVMRKVLNGSMTVKGASVRLGVSRQYLYVLKSRYLKEGVICLAHGNKGKQRQWKIPDEIAQRIVSLYKGKYQPTFPA